MGTPGRAPGDPQQPRVPRPRPRPAELVRPIRPENGDALDDASWERVRQRVADEAARAAEQSTVERRRRPVWLLPVTFGVLAVLTAAVVVAILHLR
jgi:hypothetical protein